MNDNPTLEQRIAFLTECLEKGKCVPYDKQYNRVTQESAFSNALQVPFDLDLLMGVKYIGYRKKSAPGDREYDEAYILIKQIGIQPNHMGGFAVLFKQLCTAFSDLATGIEIECLHNPRFAATLKKNGWKEQSGNYIWTFAQISRSPPLC